MKKQYGLAIVALATAMTISFTACGGDDSSSSNGPVKVSKVEELSAECEDGEEALVGEDEIVYTCTEGKWETEEVKSSESKPKSSSSSVEESDEDGDEEEEDNEEEDSSSSKEKSSASEDDDDDKPTSSTSKSSSSIGSEDSGTSSTGTGVSSSSIGSEDSGESSGTSSSGTGVSSSSIGESGNPEVSSSSMVLNPIKFSSSSAVSYAISVASTRIAYQQEFTVTVPGLTDCQYSVTDDTYLSGANLDDAGYEDNCEIGLSNDNTGVESVSFTLSVTEAKTMGEPPVAVANADLPASKTFTLCGSAQCRAKALSFMDAFVTWQSTTKAISTISLTETLNQNAVKTAFTKNGFILNTETKAYENDLYSITTIINKLTGIGTFTINPKSTFVKS